MGATSIIAPTKALVVAVKAKTDNLPADPATIAAITAIKQKATSPAWNQDTDSLEGIAESIGGAGLYTTNGVIKEYSSVAVPSIRQSTFSANANSWSGWLEIIASLSADSYLCGFTFAYNSPYTTNVCVEIAKGAVSAEVILIRVSGKRIEVAEGTGIRDPWTYNLTLPIKVAAGERLSCHVSKGNAGADIFDVSLQWYENL